MQICPSRQRWCLGAGWCPGWWPGSRSWGGRWGGSAPGWWTRGSPCSGTRRTLPRTRTSCSLKQFVLWFEISISIWRIYFWCGNACNVIYTSVTLGTGGFCNLILDMVSFFIWDYFLQYIHGKSPLERRVENTDNCIRARVGQDLRLERESFVVYLKYKETRELEECSNSTHGSRVCGEQNWLGSVKIVWQSCTRKFIQWNHKRSPPKKEPLAQHNVPMNVSINFWSAAYFNTLAAVAVPWKI